MTHPPHIFVQLLHFPDVHTHTLYLLHQKRVALLFSLFLLQLLVQIQHRHDRCQQQNLHDKLHQTVHGIHIAHI